jgi:Family of unknown function (DUF6338)
MIDTLETAVLFVLLIAPGYLCVVGFNQLSSDSATKLNASHLAQAIPASIVVVAIGWFPLAKGLIGRLGNEDHVATSVRELDTWLLLLGLFALGFCIGGAFGFLVRWALGTSERQESGLRAFAGQAAAKVFGGLGFYRPPTMWEEAARSLASARQSLIKVQLQDGSSIYGPFAENSKMTLSPRPRGLYLEQAFIEAKGGSLEEAPNGAFIMGDQVKAILILERDP